jgi:hypothetical protein
MQAPTADPLEYLSQHQMDPVLAVPEPVLPMAHVPFEPMHVQDATKGTTAPVQAGKSASAEDTAFCSGGEEERHGAPPADGTCEPTPLPATHLAQFDTAAESMEPVHSVEKVLQDDEPPRLPPVHEVSNEAKPRADGDSLRGMGSAEAGESNFEGSVLAGPVHRSLEQYTIEGTELVADAAQDPCSSQNCLAAGPGVVKVAPFRLLELSSRDAANTGAVDSKLETLDLWKRGQQSSFSEVLNWQVDPMVAGIAIVIGDAHAALDPCGTSQLPRGSPDRLRPGLPVVAVEAGSEGAVMQQGGREAMLVGGLSNGPSAVVQLAELDLNGKPKSGRGVEGSFAGVGTLYVGYLAAADGEQLSISSPAQTIGALLFHCHCATVLVPGWQLACLVAANCSSLHM